MRSVKPAMASETMLDLGRYHLAALARSEEHRHSPAHFSPRRTTCEQRPRHAWKPSRQ